MINDPDYYKRIYYTEDPINGKTAKKLRSTIFKVYTEIYSKAYYVSNPNDEIKIYDDDDTLPFTLDHLPAVLIVAHLVNRSSTLLDGSPGGGKTKTARIVSRLMTGASLINEDNIIYCDEELTKEKWLATPNVGRMMGKKNDDDHEEEIFPVIWAPFFRDDRKGMDLIIDEVNRANPKTQNEFLSLMADGIAQYTVSAKKYIPEFRIFMTRNPIDAKVGMNIYKLHFAFLDRITLSSRVFLPSTYSMKRVSEMRKDDRNYEYDEDEGVKIIMTPDEVRKATIMASKIPVTERGKRYAQYIVRDASLCLNAPGYDKTLAEDRIIASSLCDGCHFNTTPNYHCKKYYGGSFRVYKDLIAVARAYCFWLGIPRVNEHVIKSIALDVISHRVLIVPSMLKQDKNANDGREFLKNYLVDWSFSKLESRKTAEEIFQRLYTGTSTNPSKDQQDLILNAKQDLYILADLLPRVMTVEMEKNKIKQHGKILSSTDHSEYRAKAKEIKDVMKDDKMELNKKTKKLINIYEEIKKGNIPFYKNLVDMIYAGYNEIDELRNKGTFKGNGT